MAEVFDRQRRMITLGDGTELQEWRVERLADETFEYHSYVGHNYAQDGRIIYSKGAIWMIMRLSDPGSAFEEMLYRMGRTGLPGSGNDVLLTEWTARASASYFRFDQVLTEFFNG